MKEIKKKKSDVESQHDDYNEFKSDKDKDDSQCKKEEKERRKKKLSEEGKSKEYNEFESNEGEDDAQSKKKKKKKMSTESKSKESEVFERNEDEGEVEGKKRKKKKLSEEGKSKEYNEFENNEGEDDAQGRKRKKKKLSKESKSEEYNVFERNEGEAEDDVKGKKAKKKKLSEEGKSKEYNEFENNEVEDDSQGKKKTLSKESKSVEDNVFERNGGEDYMEGKKSKKKKLSKEGRSKEFNESGNNEVEDDAKGKKREKKKLRKESKSKEYSVFERNEGEDDVEGKKSKKTKMSEDSESKDKKMMAKKKAKAGNGGSPNPGDSGLSKPKRVTFSDKVEVCCDGLVRGKRFTLEEDEKIKSAVFNYIESRGLGDEGLDMVLHCGVHPEVRHCWKEIASALPHRPLASVYTRAHILFERAELRKWTPEEMEFLQKVQEQHGSNWRQVADALGKNRIHVKDAWRRVKLSNRNRGRWTQKEFQNLFDLVNMDLRVRASQSYRKSKHGMLRDNIGWEAISQKLTTRTSFSCCKKWYDKLTSPMVASGGWSDTDDYRLVSALFDLDACCMEEVDWDNLLEHRPGDVCRKRWNEIVRYIGEHGGKSFAEQVEILAKRFCPELVEVREAFDAKPLVC